MTRPASGQETAVGPAAGHHDEMAAAYHAQRERWSPQDMWSGCAGSFKADLSAPLSPFVEKVASYLQPDDVLLDVGGGAGRLSLPLASRCKEVVCIDPSPAMGEVFEATARDAGIKNARFVLASWPDAGDAVGDVSLVTHVTYFVTEIVPFVEKLNEATSRRVILGTRSVPPPNQLAPLYELVRGEPQALVPGHAELMVVLDELGIAAELIDVGEAVLPATNPPGATPDDVIRIEVEAGIRFGFIGRDEADRCRALFEQHFDELFVETPRGFVRRIAQGARELMITWEARR